MNKKQLARKQIIQALKEAIAAMEEFDRLWEESISLLGSDPRDTRRVSVK